MGAGGPGGGGERQCVGDLGVHPLRLALCKRAGLRLLLPHFLSPHLEHYVARGGLDDLGCLGVVGDGGAVDLQHDVTLHQMVFIHVAGDGSWLYVSDPGMAVVPFVVALQDEALHRKRKGIGTTINDGTAAI